MRKVIITISIIAFIALIPLTYYLFFWKNLEIINPEKEEIYLDNSLLSSKENIKIRKPFSGSFIVNKSSSFYQVSWSFKKQIIDISAHHTPEFEKFKTEGLLPSVVGPKIDGPEIAYLGGRGLDGLFKINPESKKISAINSFNLRGAIDINWNEDSTKAVIEVSNQLYQAPIFSSSDATVWVYDIENLEATPTEFSMAAYLEDGQIVGVRRGKITLYKDGSYKDISKNPISKPLGIISSGPNAVTWSEQELVIFNKEKELYRGAGKYRKAAINGAGTKVFATLEEDGKSFNRLIDTENSNSSTLPVYYESYGFFGDRTLITQDQENNIWTVDTANASGYLIKKYDYPANEIFGIEDYGYILIDSNLERLSW